MIKLTLSSIFGFLLLCVQNWVVMTWHGYHSLVYSKPSMILVMLMINFSLAFSILHTIETAVPDLFKSGGQEEEQY